MDAILRHDETKKSASFDTKNVFLGVHTNIEVTTSKKDSSQMIDMNVPLFRMSREVIEIGFNNVFNIMKSI